VVSLKKLWHINYWFSSEIVLTACSWRGSLKYIIFSKRSNSEKNLRSKIAFTKNFFQTRK
jgi:hypothetical protein